MPKINEEHIDALINLINEAPYFQLLNLRIAELDQGYCKIVVNVERKHLNAFGGIHGGAYASILDTAAYWALYCEMDEQVGFTTLDLNANNLRAIDKGVIVAEGHVIKRGRSICLCEAEARDEKGNLLAHCTSKQFVSPTLQPMSAAIANMGAKPLPPKFVEE